MRRLRKSLRAGAPLTRTRRVDKALFQQRFRGEPKTEAEDSTTARASSGRPWSAESPRTPPEGPCATGAPAPPQEGQEERGAPILESRASGVREQLFRAVFLVRTVSRSPGVPFQGLAAGVERPPRRSRAGHRVGKGKWRLQSAQGRSEQRLKASLVPAGRRRRRGPRRRIPSTEARKPETPPHGYALRNAELPKSAGTVRAQDRPRSGVWGNKAESRPNAAPWARPGITVRNTDRPDRCTAMRTGGRPPHSGQEKNCAVREKSAASMLREPQGLWADRTTDPGENREGRRSDPPDLARGGPSRRSPSLLRFPPHPSVRRWGRSR